MRVVLNTYPVAFDCPGGGEVQLLQSRAALQRRGVQVDLFDVWKPQLRTAEFDAAIEALAEHDHEHVRRRARRLP